GRVAAPPRDVDAARRDPTARQVDLHGIGPDSGDLELMSDAVLSRHLAKPIRNSRVVDGPASGANVERPNRGADTDAGRDALDRSRRIAGRDRVHDDRDRRLEIRRGNAGAASAELLPGS